MLSVYFVKIISDTFESHFIKKASAKCIHVNVIFCIKLKFSSNQYSNITEEISSLYLFLYKNMSFITTYKQQIMKINVPKQLYLEYNTRKIRNRLHLVKSFLFILICKLTPMRTSVRTIYFASVYFAILNTNLVLQFFSIALAHFSKRF